MIIFPRGGYIISIYEMVFRRILESGLGFIESLAVVASPIVAIVAIVLGNRHARERDKENIRKQLQFSHLTELLDRLCALQFKAKETGLAFLGYIIAVHKKDGSEQDHYKVLLEKETDFQMYGNTVCTYGDVVLSVISNNSNGRTLEDLYYSVNGYANILSHIMNYHNELSRSKKYSSNTVLDMTQEKLKEEDDKLEEVLISYIEQVSELIRNLSQ